MDVREKLVELLDEVHHKPLGKEYLERLGTIADYLVSHGVTVQEQDGCFRCKDRQKMTITISNKLIDGVNTGWLGGNLPARYCPFCGCRLPQPPKGE